MITLRFTFPTGHYHATPWSGHANEGQPEWPPSPWRILRALIATWYHKGHELSEETVASLIHALSSAVPSYRLPPASAGHSRHYMPIDGLQKDGYPKTTKVLDTFVLVGRDKEALEVFWPVELTDEQFATLELLITRIGYLGRAESLTIGSVMRGSPSDHEPNCEVLSSGEDAMDSDLIRLLAAESRESYQSWRNGYLHALKNPADGKKPSKSKVEKLTPPNTIFEALHADTGTLRNLGWSQPPGSRWLSWTRSTTALTPPAAPKRRTAREPVRVARFALSGPVLPSFLKSVFLAQSLHQILVRLSHGHPVFTGKKDGELMQGHRHAHIFCEPNGRGLIDHVTLFARMGFDEKAQRTFDDLVLNATGGANKIRWHLIFAGNEREAADSYGSASRNLFDRSSTRWASLTPFIKTRHTKRRNDGTAKLDEQGIAIGSAEHDLRRLIEEEFSLRHEQLPRIEIAAVKSVQLGGKEYFWQQFKRARPNSDRDRQPPETRGFGFTLTFPEPVSGPIALGHSCHFGLGLFVPVEQ